MHVVFTTCTNGLPPASQSHFQVMHANGQVHFVHADNWSCGEARSHQMDDAAMLSYPTCCYDGQWCMWFYHCHYYYGINGGLDCQY